MNFLELKSGVSRIAFLPEDLENTPLPCLSQLLEVSQIPWFVAPHHSDLFLSPFLTLTLLLPSFIFKDPCDYTGPTQIIVDNPPSLDH